MVSPLQEVKVTVSDKLLDAESVGCFLIDPVSLQADGQWSTTLAQVQYPIWVSQHVL